MSSDPPLPSSRVVLAQSWSLIAELARRHPDHLVHEMHPGGGMYDVLALLPPMGPPDIQLNRAGSLHVFSNGRFHLTWAEVLAAQSSRDVVHALEKASGLDSPERAPKATRRTVAYRFIAALLRAAVDDGRHAWDIRNDVIDASDYMFGRPRHGYLEKWPAAQEDARRAPRFGTYLEPESHFWAVLRDGEPVALVSTEGRFYRHDRTRDLLKAYVTAGRRITPLVGRAMGDLLP